MPFLKRTWDLDFVRESGKWQLLNWEPELTIVAEIRRELEDRGSGTCVLWTGLDRLVSGEDGDLERWLLMRSFLMPRITLA